MMYVIFLLVIMAHPASFAHVGLYRRPISRYPVVFVCIHHGA